MAKDAAERDRPARRAVSVLVAPCARFQMGRRGMAVCARTERGGRHRAGADRIAGRLSAAGRAEPPAFQRQAALHHQRRRQRVAAGASEIVQRVERLLHEALFIPFRRLQEQVGDPFAGIAVRKRIASGSFFQFGKFIEQRIDHIRKRRTMRKILN